MAFDDETLMAFVDGELDAARAAVVAQAIERDPALAAEVDRLRAVRARVADAFAPVLDEDIPERLQAAATARPNADGGRTGRVYRSAPWSAMAAGLAGLVIGVGAAQVIAAPSGVGHLNTNFVADGALARVLDVAESGAPMQRRGLEVTPLYSFIAHDGRTCRAFVAARGAAAAEGVACREEGVWRLLVVAPAERTAPGTGGAPSVPGVPGIEVFRQADGGEPAAVSTVIDEIMSDDILDEIGRASCRERV